MPTSTAPPTELTSEAVALVRDLLVKTGTTQADLSRTLGISRASIAVSLDPDNRITLPTLQTYAEALGYRIELNAEPINTRG